MSSAEAERFVKGMEISFGRYIDEVWEPRMGPLPQPWSMGPLPEPWGRWGPLPDPWRELSIAYDVVKLADYLELASKGLGESMVRRYAEEPLDPCGNRPPGWPFPIPGGKPHPPPGEEPIVNLGVLGAALAFVGEGAGSEAVRGAAIEAGTRIAG